MDNDTSPVRRMRKHLTGGNIWLYVLALLKKKRYHAYSLDEAIEKQFGFRPNRIMVYVVLYKLEAEGLINSATEGRRKYYKITNKGIAAAKQAKAYLKKLSDII
ncbi:MAG: PadR family transcriptional regulator [Candidatus Micrarchaeota archaeon]